MKDTSFNPGLELAKRHLIQFEEHEKMISDLINGTMGPEDAIWQDVPQTAGDQITKTVYMEWVLILEGAML